MGSQAYSYQDNTLIGNLLFLKVIKLKCVKLQGTKSSISNQNVRILNAKVT
jgi:hypothetical protein